MTFDDWPRSAVHVENESVSLNPQGVIDRGIEIAHVDRILGWFCTVLVARTVNDSAADTTSRQYGTVDIPPMISTSILVDLRCASEFTGPDD